MTANVVVVLEAKLSDSYGAQILWKFDDYEALFLNSIILDEKFYEKIAYKNVLIVGDYFSESVEKILAFAESLTWFLPKDTVVPKSIETKIKIVFADPELGFSHWVTTTLENTTPTQRRIATYLDTYTEGFPDADCFCFHHGLYANVRGFIMIELEGMTSEFNVNSMIDRGKLVFKDNIRIAQSRLKYSKSITVTVGGSPHQVLFSFGDSHATLTALLLAEKSIDTIGVVVRYDLANNVTHLHGRIAKQSGINIGIFFKRWVNGKGSRISATAVLDGIVDPITFSENKVS